MKIAQTSGGINIRRVQEAYQQIALMTNEMGNPDLERLIGLTKEAFVWISEMDTYTLTPSSFVFFHLTNTVLIFKLIEIKKSEIAGGGWELFSCHNFAVGEVIKVYIGTVLIEHAMQSSYSVSNG